jgi:hypothetical protein
MAIQSAIGVPTRPGKELAERLRHRRQRGVQGKHTQQGGSTPWRFSRATQTVPDI